MAKTPEELAQEMTNKIDGFKTELANAATKEMATAIEKKIDDFIETNKGNIASVTKQFEDLTEQLNQVKDKLTSGNEGKKTFKEEVADKFEKIKEIKSNVTKEVVLKDLTVRANIDGNEQAVILPDVGQLATRNTSLIDIFPRINVGRGNHNGTVTYYDWDEATTVRAAAMRAEGAAFPESTAKWKKYSIPLQKIGDTLPVTEEFFEDAVMFAAELEMFLRVNVALVADNQLCNGDGQSNNLKGLLASVPAYVPVGSDIDDANIYDLLVKMREGVAKPYGGKYTPNIAIMNLTTINRYKLKKDGENNYVVPPFVSANGDVVDGLRVIESNIMPDNQLVVGDQRFARIYEMGDVMLSRAHVNEQFIEDAITLKARKRLLFLIRTVDATGFLKCTDIDAALTTLESAPSV